MTEDIERIDSAQDNNRKEYEMEEINKDEKKTVKPATPYRGYGDPEVNTVTFIS